MTEHRYLEVMADTTDAFLRAIGVLGPYIDTGRSYYTVETHIRHLGEARGGDRICVATRLLGHDDKRLHLFHELRRDEDDGLIATGEHMLLHVDRAAGAHHAGGARDPGGAAGDRRRPARAAVARGRGQPGARAAGRGRLSRRCRSARTSLNSFEPICAERAERLVYVRRLIFS